MKSLNPKSNLKYFDQVHLSSWLSASTNYQFASEKDLISRACDPYPYKDSLNNNGEIEIYKGFDFCVILERFTRQEALTILPNWKCDGPDDFCRKLGPFVSSGKEINATDGSFEKVKLVLQDVSCENITSKENDGFTRVFSVFRAVPPSENQFTASQRTGLSNMTLSAEGIWKPSSGQLCMIGCLGFACDTRIYLYIPLSFTIKQRSIILGTISSVNSANESFFPLTFEKIVCVAELWDRYSYSRPYYKYSKIRAARKQRENILSRRGIEGMLRILTLSIAILCISSQLFYVRDNAESVPYVSLVMLGVQVVGYGVPLITGAEALLKKALTEFGENESYELRSRQWVHVIDYTVKFLVLIAFSLTLRLCQKVWKSRVRMLTRAPLEPHRVPSDRKVLLSTLVVHVLGYILVLVVHYVNTSEWETKLEEYLGLVQDFFLLPQVIANLMWRINVKPLGKLYYLGITSVRLFPHVYDYVSSPIPNPYFAEEYEFVNPRVDFYSRFGDVFIPTLAVVLALAVYVQQRWDCEKLSRMFSSGRARFLPMGSKVYERLPSVVPFEVELASGIENTNSTSEKVRDME
ncbi:hypothetical protein PHJA_001821800 [Phtheirospermum japonicum]|uniref:RING-type E3 ubiquitin transferase n=1 Tax=Phtheirospermum japonicum TaxID=374723 RepID=A0A830C7T7_9LAMI|nr:hypothetical protein PHJA_001821800 [Phtheirospermum japonicum]